jgi:hypothetical protein
VGIEHISKASVRKEDMVARVLEQRGDHPGLVYIISAMESCVCYRPWRDKATGKVFVRRPRLRRGRLPPENACITTSTSWIRSSDWCTSAFPPPPSQGQAYAPFRLQFYCNGHSWPDITAPDSPEIPRTSRGRAMT